MPMPMIAEEKKMMSKDMLAKHSKEMISKPSEAKIVPKKRMTTRMNEVIKKRFLAQA